MGISINLVLSSRCSFKNKKDIISSSQTLCLSCRTDQNGEYGSNDYLKLISSCMI